ncbi:MAG: hypothetical protein K8S25_01475 [Alphaproteobacteria bacterium]|nr:hypothetical protein [Alphaproteobacteria bacterium]
MQRAKSIMLWLLTVSAISLSLIIAVIWPWPAPTLDWHSPYKAALANGDCNAALNIAIAAAASGAIGVRRLNEIEGSVKCQNAPLHGPHAADIGYLSALRHADQSDYSIYSLNRHNLGPLRHQFVSSAIFLCAAPYNGVHQVDNAELSRALPEQDGPIIALHRLRREICVEFLEHLAGALVDASDAPANNVADRLLLSPPLQKTMQANYLYARLLLEKGFTPSWMHDSNNSQPLIEYMREVALDRLERAASTGHQKAIRLIISILHAGLVRPRNDKEAYFWVLRLRRLGGADKTEFAGIEAALSDADRVLVRLNEENTWSDLQKLTLAP